MVRFVPRKAEDVPAEAGDVPTEAGDGPAERDPRVLVTLLLVCMAVLFRMVGCTVALQGYLMSGVQITLLMCWFQHIDTWSAPVTMITLTILTGITTPDIEFCLKYPSFHEHLQQCAVTTQIVAPA